MCFGVCGIKWSLGLTTSSFSSAVLSALSSKVCVSCLVNQPVLCKQASISPLSADLALLMFVHCDVFKILLQILDNHCNIWELLKGSQSFELP